MFHYLVDYVGTPAKSFLFIIIIFFCGGIGKKKGVPIVNASNNHFPCDCHIVSWMKSAMFANQSRERMMANNYCISPYEVHGKSIQSAAEEAHLFGGCADDDPPERTVALETTKPSTLFSSSSCSSMNGQSMTILIALYLLFQQFVQL